MCSKKESCPAESKWGINPAAFPKIDTLCQGMVDEGYTPGAVLIIGQGDKILYQKVYGNRFTDRGVEPMTLDTLFDLASITKPTCTASAIMFLVQDGRISLDDPVTKYVPEFRGKDKDDITIRHLLTHISGLPAYTSASALEKKYGPRPNPEGLIEGISNLDKAAPTGTKYIYSCLNYLTLARVAQNVTGKNNDTFLRERLWGPLGMRDATFYPTEEQIARTAPTINNENEGVRCGMVHDPLAYYSICPSYSSGNAGGFATALDMSRYCRMILSGGKWKGKTIFKPEIWEQITTDQVPGDLADRSCGWGVWTSEDYATELNQTPETCCLGHTGYTGGIVWMDKLSKSYVILFTNCVYPVDKSENKNAVIKARKQVIRTVLDHLDIYQEVNQMKKAES